MEDHKNCGGESSNCSNPELKELVIQEGTVLEGREDAVANLQGAITRRAILVVDKGIRCDLSLLEDPEFQKRGREFRLSFLKMRARESRNNIIRLTVLSAIGVILLTYVIYEFT